MRRLVHHHRPRLGREAAQPCRAVRLPSMAGNPTNRNPSPPMPDAEIAASAALGPGIGSTRIPAACAAATSRAPGSETTGVPASDTSATDSPAEQALDEPRRSRRLVVLVEARRRRRDRVVLKEPGRPAGVLRGDHGHFAQDPQRAQRDILEIADGCRDHIQGAGHDSPGDCTQCIQPNPFRTSSTNIWHTSTRSTPRRRRSTASTFTTTCSRTSAVRPLTRRSARLAGLPGGWPRSTRRG